jgi:hypothetical protein
MPKSKFKYIDMLVRVRVPSDTTPAEARREVRTLVTHQCAFQSRLEGEVRVVRCTPAPKDP